MYLQALRDTAVAAKGKAGKAAKPASASRLYTCSEFVGLVCGAPELAKA